MKVAKIGEINTTAGKRILIVTGSKSKEFKKIENAEKWAKNNGYKIERC